MRLRYRKLLNTLSKGVARVSQRDEMKSLPIKNEYNLTSLFVINTSP